MGCVPVFKANEGTVYRVPLLVWLYQPVLVTQVVPTCKIGTYKVSTGTIETCQSKIDWSCAAIEDCIFKFGEEPPNKTAPISETRR